MHLCTYAFTFMPAEGAKFFQNVVNESSASPRMLIIHECMGRACGYVRTYIYTSVYGCLYVYVYMYICTYKHVIYVSMSMSMSMSVSMYVIVVILIN